MQKVPSRHLLPVSFDRLVAHVEAHERRVSGPDEDIGIGLGLGGHEIDTARSRHGMLFGVWGWNSACEMGLAELKRVMKCAWLEFLT